MTSSPQPSSPLNFPCEFPIKAIGKADLEFEQAVVMITRRHFPRIGEAAFNFRKSKNGNYFAATIMVTAESQQQLDEIYTELSAHEKIIMVL